MCLTLYNICLHYFNNFSIELLLQLIDLIDKIPSNPLTQKLRLVIKYKLLHCMQNPIYKCHHCHRVVQIHDYDTRVCDFNDVVHFTYNRFAPCETKCDGQIVNVNWQAQHPELVSNALLNEILIDSLTI